MIVMSERDREKGKRMAREKAGETEGNKRREETKRKSVRIA